MKQILKTASLSSDRLDWTCIESEIRLKHYQMFPFNYADSLMGNNMQEKQLRHFPNSYVLHNVDEIDQAKVKMSFKSENVESSQNILVWVAYQTSHEILNKAVQMAQKHQIENTEKVPETIV